MSKIPQNKEMKKKSLGCLQHSYHKLPKGEKKCTSAQVANYNKKTYLCPTAREELDTVCTATWFSTLNLELKLDPVAHSSNPSSVEATPGKLVRPCFKMKF